MAKAPMTITTLDGGSPLDGIRAALADLGEKDIEGALTVVGHEYWVILEFGSSPMAPTPGPTDDDPVALILPLSVPDQNEYYPESAHHGTYYPIAPRRAKWLKFFDRGGRERLAKVVHHPGNYARGFLRQLIPIFVDEVADDFTAMFDGGQGRDDLGQYTASIGDAIPSRQQLLDVFNTRLYDLLAEIRLVTPVADGRPTHPERSDVTPLAIAWDIDLATE